MSLHVVAVRVGQKYSRDYLAILHDSVCRNLADEFTFWCLTDDPRPVHPDIGLITADPSLPGWWAKVQLFSPEMPWEPGDRIIYLDLDVAIVGRLEDLAERKGVIRDWNRPGMNSSVMVWDHGEHRNAWASWMPEFMEEYDGDQDYLMAMSADADPWHYFPRDWFVSYKKLDSFPPVGTKAAIFHGRPKPDQCDGWVKDVWRVGGFAEFPQIKATNISLDKMLENIEANSKRDLPWFIGSKPHKDTLVIVGGAPSMKTRIPEIKAHRQRGAKILALNNAGTFLNSHGIVPDTLLVIDGRVEGENVSFVRAEAKGYVLASQCDPSLFDALEGKPVHLLHCGVSDEMIDLLKPYNETKPICVIGGGSTVGLRAGSVAIVSGYQKVHIYGMDSCFAGDEHHAYAQPLNDRDHAYEITMPATGKRYLVAPWMARQAAEFRDLLHPAFEANNVRYFVHGEGLIPDMAKVLQGKWESAA